MASTVIDVVGTAPVEDSGPTLSLSLNKITSLNTFIIQMCQEALCHKQSHNSEYPTGGGGTHPFLLR